ncbi:hypothetical protein D3C87_419890 [compost metagenome]
MKKKINIALIIVVLSLWGAVGYRFISNYFFDKNENNIILEKTLPFKNLIVERDTFLLQSITRDPFLNKIEPAISISKTFSKLKIITSKNKIENKPLTTMEWPNIQYFGYIKSGKNNELALVKLNGQLLRVHEGEKKNDLVIQSVHKDSIIVVFKKEKKTFRVGV